MGELFCAAVYDAPDKEVRSDSHTCHLEAGHGEVHHCDLCGKWWSARVSESKVEAAGGRALRGPSAEQVELAREDARGEAGVGYVRITRSADDTLSYHRVSPDAIRIGTGE
jgi:hypothetical protein